MAGIFTSGRVGGAFNGRLLFSCIIIMLSQVNFGIDTTAFSTTQAMSAFEKKFGVYRPSLKRYAIEPYFLSLLNSLTYIGQVFGLLLGSYIARRWGRRMSFFVMCVWAWISAILLVTAQHKEQVLIGRILNFVYVGMELAVVPVTQSELVPARVRGFVVGTYQLGILVGALLISVVCLGTSKLEGDNSWRIPFGLFFIIPTIVFFGTFYIPESPRWLLLRNRPDDARANLELLRRGRFSDEEIEAEFQTLVASININVEKGSFKEIWQGNNLKRTLVCIGTNFFLQATGQSFTSKYGAVFVKDIGAIDPFVFKTINSVIIICAVLLAMYITDSVGRKSLLIIGSVIQAGSLLAMGGLGTTDEPSKSAKIGITALTTVFAVGFNFGLGPVSHVITAELPSSRLRDITYATASTVAVVTSFAVTFNIPYLLYEPYAALEARVGFIFGSISFVAAIFAIFCVPECKNMTLEEIDYLFNENTPLLKFRKFKHGEIIPEELIEENQRRDDKPELETKEVV